MSRPINRSLADPAMDDIDHALGRPKNPQRPNYRNYYAVGTGTDLAERMRRSPHWRTDSTINDGTTTVFTVTTAGMLALAAHLAEIEEMASRASHAGKHPATCECGECWPMEAGGPKG